MKKKGILADSSFLLEAQGYSCNRIFQNKAMVKLDREKKLHENQTIKEGLCCTLVKF